MKLFTDESIKLIKQNNYYLLSWSNVVFFTEWQRLTLWWEFAHVINFTHVINRFAKKTWKPRIWEIYDKKPGICEILRKNLEFWTKSLKKIWNFQEF